MWIQEKIRTNESITSTKIYNKFGFRNVVGVGHAGLKAIAGPIHVCAVILPPHHKIPNLVSINSTRSKVLGKKETEKTIRLILKKATYIRYGLISNLDVFHRGKKEAIRVAINEALITFSRYNPASCIFIDYPEYVPGEHMAGIPFFTEFGLRELVDSVAAASLLAKTRTETILKRMHKEYPEYGWDKNFGYPTREHMHAINEHGRTVYHRFKKEA
jgi:ribonuclease HII